MSRLKLHLFCPISQKIRNLLKLGVVWEGVLVDNLGDWIFEGINEGVNFCSDPEVQLIIFMPHWQTFLINVIKKLFS